MAEAERCTVMDWVTENVSGRVLVFVTVFGAPSPGRPRKRAMPKPPGSRSGRAAWTSTRPTPLPASSAKAAGVDRAYPLKSPVPMRVAPARPINRHAWSSDPPLSIARHASSIT